MRAMAKNTSQFVCQECGSIYKKWAGKCDACGAWDSILEESISSSFTKLATTKQKATAKEFVSLAGEAEELPRVSTYVSELDRVLGGGLVPGSAILIGGDPGIGKSTLLLQVAAYVASNDGQFAYISGEESVDQVRLRAQRLGLSSAPVDLMAATSVTDIVASLEKMQRASTVVIDSIQTMFVDSIASAPGTVSQVRAAAHELITLAKSKGVTIIFVGHVTKDGQIAGPKVLEHMVDCVLYFEGERGHQFRILRAVKNRFGPANEIGVFEMVQEGLKEVLNPSSLFLAEREFQASGSTVFAGMEGTRPLLVEVQALVSPTSMATPRRAVVGWDSNRLAMVLAILQTRYGLFLADKEVYLNIAGGLRIDEPAIDLAVAAAIISSVSDTPLPNETVIFGELGLSGEVRMVSQADIRLKEATKLGFTSAITPYGVKKLNNSFQLSEIRHIRELTSFFRKSKQAA